VTALLSPAQELYDDVRELLANYSAACPRLKVEFLDPAREPVRAEALVKKFGLQSAMDLRFVVFECGGRSKQVDLGEFIEYDFSSPMGGQPRVKAFKGEQAFTGAILSVMQSEQAAICFTTGHGEAGLDDQGDRGLSQVRDALRSANYRTAAWDSLSGGAVPDGCRLLVIAGPTRGFLESEVRAIGSYLQRGGRLLALLDPELGRDGSIVPTGLESLLQEYGATLGQDLVVDRGDPQIVVLGAGPETLVVRDLPEHPVTRNLGGTAVIMPLARSVSPASPAPARLKVETIARTSAEGWAETNLASLATGITKDPSDLAGPVPVALAVSPAGDDGTDGTLKETAAPTGRPAGKPPGARLVVVGDSDFAVNGFVMRLGNLDLTLNAIHWLAEQETLIGIEPRTPEQVLLTLTPDEAWRLVLLVLVGLPAAAVIAGLAVWWRRRS